MSTDLVLDPFVQYEQLREKFLAADPEPPRCTEPGHRDPERCRREGCETCKAYYNWRQRLNYTLRRGPKAPPEPVNDPKPPPCPHGHVRAANHMKDCEFCREHENWRGRDYRRRRRTGQLHRFDDLPRLLEHLDALEAGGLITFDIAAKSGVSDDTVRGLRTGRLTFVTPRTAKKILAIPVPERRFQLIPSRLGAVLPRIDATGTQRRIRCAQGEGHSIASQATRLGWTPGTIDHWLRSSTVTIEVADAVAALYPQLIEKPGPSHLARALAANKGWPRARHFSEANIDDPAYDPFTLVDDPFGVYRRLRAMAVIGQGPTEVGPRIGEAPETVEVWMEGGPAPAYALHLVAADYERWCTTPGADQRAADRARHQDWASALAWDGIDIDRPSARPRHDAPVNLTRASLTLGSVVLDAINGNEVAGNMTHDERLNVVEVLHRRGWCDRCIAFWLRWHPGGDVDKGQKAVCKTRQRNRIRGAGVALTGQCQADTDARFRAKAAAAATVPCRPAVAAAA